MKDPTAAQPASLVVSLVRDPGEASFFLADICEMLGCVAALADARLEPSAGNGAASANSTTYRWSGPDTALLAELGRHRAQYVPASSTIGRVMTAEVVVELRPPVTDTGSFSVVKTYNYVQSRATRHEPRRIGTLDEALSGKL